LIAFNNTLGSRTISNLTLNASGVASSFIGFQTNTGYTYCKGFVVKMTSGLAGCYTNGGGIIDGIICNVSGTTIGIAINNGKILNSVSFSVSGDAINCTSGSGQLIKCYGESTSAIGINSNIDIIDSRGVGSTYGIQISGGYAENCTGFSSSGVGVYFGGNTSKPCSKIVGISSASWGIRIYSTASVNNLTAFSSTTYALVCDGGSGIILNNVHCESPLQIPFYTSGGLYYNLFSKCTWNNSAGHSVSIAGNNVELINSTMQVANASANCINSGSAYTTKYIRSTFKGATTPVNANITQGQTNTEDNQGNITVN
jgi:hypothetical protein